MATHDTKLGIGLANGMFYHAPAGTALPSYPTASLASAWKKVGDVSSDGITLTFDKSTTNLRNWANDLKRVVLTEHAETIAAPIMDTTQEVLETILGDGATTKTTATSAHGEVITAGLTQSELPPEEAYLFLMKDDDDAIAIGCENGQITSMDSVTFAPGSAITWTPTITALEDGWQIITDDGQTAS